MKPNSLTLARITRFSLRKKHRKSVLTAKILPTLVVASAAYAIRVLFPAPHITQLTNRVFSDGVRIELDRSSPAFAAMEDTLLGNQLTEFDSVGTPESAAPVEMLLAGNRSAIEIASMISRENRRETALVAQARAAREAQEAMLVQAAAVAFEKMAAKFSAASHLPYHPSQGKGGSPMQLASLATPPTADANASAEAADASIPNEQAREISDSAIQNVAVQAEPAMVEKTIHLSEVGLSREEFMRQFFMPLATADVSDVAPDTMVAAQAFPAHSRRTASERLGGLAPNGRTTAGPRWGRGAPVQENSFSSPNQLEGHSASGRDDVFAESIHTPGGPSGKIGVQKSPSASADPTSQPAATAGQLTVAGQFEFSDGLALTNPSDVVVIFRENDGQVFEQAAIWLKKASYEIFMEKPEGDLVAELRSPQGDLLGRARMDLAAIQQSSGANPYRISGINLKIRPVPQGVTGQVLAIDQTPIGQAHVQFENLPLQAVSTKTGRFDEPSLMENSAVELAVHHAGYLPTRVGAFAGQNSQVILLPARAVRMIQSLQPTPHDNSTAMIFGRVTRSHAPVSGAQVTLATTGEDRKVIYFNSKFEPDPTLEATEANGLYAFYGVTAGEQNVRATWGSGMSEIADLTAVDRMAQQVDLELSQNQTSKVRVFDAFRTDWPLAAQIHQQASDVAAAEISHTGSGEIRYSSGQKALVLDADGGQNYEVARLVTDRDRKSIFVPMIQSAWLDEIRGSARVSKDPRSGAVVGFIQGVAPFEVAMDEKSVQGNSKLLYFNSRGEVTRENYGEPGGGFIIFNLPEGPHSVLIQAKGMAKSFAATLQIDSRVTNVINHWMR